MRSSTTRAREGWRLKQSRAGNFWAKPVSMHPMHTVALFLAVVSLGLACMAQTPQTPNVEAQRAAMQKLTFVVGKRSGGAFVLRGPGQFIDMVQTEEAQFKLDGLVLM